MRLFWLFLILGCSSAPAERPREETALDRLRARANAYRTFRARYELSAGKETVAIELAWRAPDRAILRYGTGTVILFAEGVGHFFVKRTYFELDYDAEIARLRREYAGLLPEDVPQLVLGLGDWEAVLAGRGLRPVAGHGRPGARLAWLDDLAGFREEGRLYRRASVSIELREDGFIESATIGSAGRMTLLELSIDQPLDDEVFVLPPRAGLQDFTDRARENLLRALEDDFHRWVLQSSLENATLEALVRVDLARRYEPEKMLAVLRSGLDESLAAYRKQNPDAPPALLKQKLELDRGKSLGGVEVMEKEIQQDFERALDRYFRGLPAPPPARAMKDAAARWRAVVARQIVSQIRRPFEQVFAEKLKE